MFKMGLHDPFGHLKCKLWPKEKLAPTLYSFIVFTFRFTFESIKEFGSVSQTKEKINNI
jgi:hypothetical protein